MNFCKKFASDILYSIGITLLAFSFVNLMIASGTRESCQNNDDIILKKCQSVSNISDITDILYIKGTIDYKDIVIFFCLFTNAILFLIMSIKISINSNNQTSEIIERSERIDRPVSTDVGNQREQLEEFSEFNQHLLA